MSYPNAYGNRIQAQQGYQPSPPSKKQHDMPSRQYSPPQYPPPPTQQQNVSHQGFNSLRQQYPPPPAQTRQQYNTQQVNYSLRQKYPPPNYPPPPSYPPLNHRSSKYPPPPPPPLNTMAQNNNNPTPLFGSDPVFTSNDPTINQANYPQPPYSAQNPAPNPVPYNQQEQQVPGALGNGIILHVDRNMQDQPVPNFKLSNCQGRKRALLIGINYTGSSNALRGCINDVKNLKQFLLSLYNFNEGDMVILTDDQNDAKFQPTKQNILNAMRWLVHDAKENDSFFFHYSGHGGRVKDLDGDEDDGYDETIYPVDFSNYPGESGQIVDDEMHDIMVRSLPRGCRLTAIFDSCHSGTALDLPYVYSTQGNIKEDNILKEAGAGLLTAGVAYAKGNKAGAISSMIGLGKTLKNKKNVSELNKQTKSSEADVIMFSGCKDSQTSADTVEENQSTGAMSYAFTSALRQNQQLSYIQLLNTVRDTLREKYSQRPQLSSSHPIDVNLTFII